MRTSIHLHDSTPALRGTHPTDELRIRVTCGIVATAAVPCSRERWLRGLSCCGWCGDACRCCTTCSPGGSGGRGGTRGSAAEEDSLVLLLSLCALKLELGFGAGSGGLSGARFAWFLGA